MDERSERGNRGSGQVPRRQGGYILPFTLVVLVLGAILLVPLLGYGGMVFRSITETQDDTSMYYAASAGIQATMADLIQGIDAAPAPPDTYEPPTVTINNVEPQVAVDVIETPVLMKNEQITSYVAGNPTVLVGEYRSGSGDNLDVDDTSYYTVRSTGTPSALAWEVTSDPITFDSATFVTVFFVGRNDRGYVRVEFYVYNPDDPDHTEGGYHPDPDATLTLAESSTDYTSFFFMSEADLDYINSLETKVVKMKVRAWRSLGEFSLEADRLVFDVAGVTAIDTKSVDGNPTVLQGTYQSGSGADLSGDDTAYYTVESLSDPLSLAWEATSKAFGFSLLDTTTLNWVARTSQDDVAVELYVYNPNDPAHTDGGYDTVPDLTVQYPTRNVDKAADLSLDSADVSYINTLDDKVVRVKVKAYRTAGTQRFRLEADKLTFTGTSLTAPLQVVGQARQQYINPGVTNPDLATVSSREGYLVRFHDVKAGLISVNWAYSPAGPTKIMVFRGYPTDNNGVIIPPGRITELPPVQGNDLVTQSASAQRATEVGTLPKMVEAGVYTIVFWNSSLNLLETKQFAPAGDYGDTWIWGIIFRDYLITGTAADTTVNAVVRMTPGRSEPPEPPWTRENVSWIPSEATIISWEPP